MAKKQNNNGTDAAPAAGEELDELLPSVEWAKLDLSIRAEALKAALVLRTVQTPPMTVIRNAQEFESYLRGDRDETIDDDAAQPHAGESD